MPPYRCCRIKATEVGMGYQAVPAQRELFSRAAPKMSLPPEVMQQILLLFEKLLAEAAIYDLAVTERVDEQNHA
jgi:hypothetical protein